MKIWAPVSLKKYYPGPRRRQKFFAPKIGKIKFPTHVKTSCPTPPLITRGPRAFYRSTDNQQQTVQSEKKTTRRIQINACVVGNTSVCCCEHLVWRRISSKENAFRYLFLPRPRSIPWNIWPKPLQEWQHSKWSLLPLKLSLTPSCPALDPPRADLIKSLNTCAGNETSSLLSFINIHRAVL